MLSTGDTIHLTWQDRQCLEASCPCCCLDLQQPMTHPLRLPSSSLDSFKIPATMSYLVFSHQAWAEVSGATRQPERRFMVLLSTPDSQRLWSHSREEAIAQQGGPPAEPKPSTWSHLCPQTPSLSGQDWVTERAIFWEISTIHSDCLSPITY